MGVEEPSAWLSLFRSNTLPENHGFLFTGTFQVWGVRPGNDGRALVETLAFDIPGNFGSMLGRTGPLWTPLEFRSFG
jgi:hypothetical protein